MSVKGRLYCNDCEQVASLRHPGPAQQGFAGEVGAGRESQLHTLVIPVKKTMRIPVILDLRRIWNCVIYVHNKHNES